MVNLKKIFHLALLFFFCQYSQIMALDRNNASDRMLSSFNQKTAAALENWATYIVVGAGAAGSVVAARLAENPDNNVLVIELGPNNFGNPFIENPTTYGLLWEHPFGPNPSPTSLAFETSTQMGRKYRYPRGNGFGGSTNHHALVDGRGSAQIYDKIADLVGDKRWAYQNILPYYKKMESYNVSPVDKNYHGTNGWLQVIQSTAKSPLHADFMKAAHQTTGAPIRKDPSGNPKNADGISRINEHITPDGKRSSAFENLLMPQILRSNNIIVLFNTLATKVLIEEQNDTLKAIGVETLHKPHAYEVDTSLIDPKVHPNHKARKFQFNAQKEVILSGGAINTPQLLLLSGVGPSKHLKDMHIPIILDHPGVGSDLMDHHEISVTYEIDPKKFVWPSQAASIVDEIDSALKKSKSNKKKQNELKQLRTRFSQFADKEEQKRGRGSIILDWYSGMDSDIGHDLHIDAGEGFWFDFDLKSKNKLPNGRLRSDYFNSEHTITHPDFPRVFHYFLLEVLKISKADGTIRLASSDPTKAPILDLALYKDDEAVERMARGILMLRKIVRHPLVNHYYKLDAKGNPIEIFPGAHYKTIDQLKKYLNRWSAFGHHIGGTAKMGRADNPSAVVDTQLRVHGIPNLRVIDTSIYPFPYLHGYNTARGAYLIGEMGADLIKAAALKKTKSKKFVQSDESKDKNGAAPRSLADKARVTDRSTKAEYLQRKKFGTGCKTNLKPVKKSGCPYS